MILIAWVSKRLRGTLRGTSFDVFDRTAGSTLQAETAGRSSSTAWEERPSLRANSTSPQR
ncbi:unnamed protein product [Ixodes pacificus]